MAQAYLAHHKKSAVEALELVEVALRRVLGENDEAVTALKCNHTLAYRGAELYIGVGGN